MNKIIWTIGHSNRALQEFISLLQTNKIALIADVRMLPGSNKYPHYNSDVLEDSLRDAGIGYAHYTRLGGRRKAKKDSHNTIWKNGSFRAYADYMESADFEDGLQELKETASGKNVALMCAEAVWWRCHRALISDRLKTEGWKVMHILSETQVKEHPYTSAASVKNGQLVYGEGNGE